MYKPICYSNLILVLIAGIFLSSCERFGDFERQFFWFQNVTGFVSEDSIFVKTQLRDVGSKNISQHGYCYSDTDSLPTLNNQVINLGDLGGAKNFEAYLTGLVPNTQYYIRPFVVIDNQANYDDVFSAKTTSVIFINSLTNTSPDNYPVELSISDTYSEPIREYGLVWATNPSPIFSDSRQAFTSAIGAGQTVSDTLKTTLTTQTQYYLRAYLISESGKDTTYSNEKSFFVPKLDPNQ